MGWCLLVLLCLLPLLSHAETRTATPATFSAQVRALRPGDTLHLASGHYGVLSWQQETLPSGTSWDAPVTLQAAPGATPVFGGIDIRHVRYVIFAGLVVDAAGRDGVFLGQGADHIRFQDGEVKNASGQGISGWESVDVHLLRMRVHHNGQTRLHHGVYIAIPDTRIEDSEFYANSGYGIQIYNGKGCCAHNTVIQRNKIYDNRGDGGVTLNHGHGMICRDNELWNNGHGGVQVSYGHPQDVQIVGNVIRDTARGFGIEIGVQSQRATVRGNVLCRTLAPQLVDKGQATRVEGNTLRQDGCPAGELPPLAGPVLLPAPRGLRVLGP